MGKGGYFLYVHRHSAAPLQLYAHCRYAETETLHAKHLTAKQYSLDASLELKRSKCIRVLMFLSYEVL